MPENTVYKQFVWRHMLGASHPLEQFTTWTLTGIAALVGLLISQLNSARTLVSLAGIRYALMLFALSLLFAVLSKYLAMTIANVLEMQTRMETPEGVPVPTIPPTMQLAHEMAEPFLWTHAPVIRWAVKQGLADPPLGSYRVVIRVFCVQEIAWFCHVALAMAGIVVLAWSLQAG